jgi:hypothetical protein
MPELEPFGARLEAAVHGFADRAQTSVDAAATAEWAMHHRHRGRLAWLGIAVPIPISILVVMVLLVLALAASLGVGAPKLGQDAALPIVGVSPAATSAAPPTTDPALDGEGDEVVSGTLTLALTTPYTETRAGDVTRLRDGVITVTARMSDPRVSGTGTWRVSADLSPATGPRWGPYRLDNADGAWVGTCSGPHGTRVTAAPGPAGWPAAAPMTATATSSRRPRTSPGPTTSAASSIPASRRRPSAGGTRHANLDSRHTEPRVDRCAGGGLQRRRGTPGTRG